MVLLVQDVLAHLVEARDRRLTVRLEVQTEAKVETLSMLYRVREAATGQEVVSERFATFALSWDRRLVVLFVVHLSDCQLTREPETVGYNNNE